MTPKPRKRKPHSETELAYRLAATYLEQREIGVAAGWEEPPWNGTERRTWASWVERRKK